MRYKIELKYSYGWDDAGWTEEINGEDVPVRYETVAEAQEDIAQFLANVNAAVAAGDMLFGRDAEEYRVVEAEG
jgi:hypothetical protein